MFNFEAASGLRWARSFFPTSGAEPFTYVVDAIETDGGLFGILAASAAPRTRLATTAQVALVAGDTSIDASGYWFELDAAGLLLGGGRLSPKGTFGWEVAAHGGSRVVAGLTSKSVSSGTLIDDVDNGFVMQVGSWENLLAEPATTSPEDTFEEVEGAPPVGVIVSANGTTVASTVRQPCTVSRGMAAMTLSPDYGETIGLIMRVNSGHALECQ